MLLVIGLTLAFSLLGGVVMYKSMRSLQRLLSKNSVAAAGSVLGAFVMIPFIVFVITDLIYSAHGGSHAYATQIMLCITLSATAGTVAGCIPPKDKKS